MPRWFGFCCVLGVCIIILSCTKAPSEQAAKHESRGDAYVQQEKFREAVIEYKNAARATPENAVLQWKLAKAALKGGDASAAYLALSRVVQLDPSHFDAKWSLGDLYLAAGKMEEVGKIAEALVAANPQHPAGYLLRAAVALGADRVADAIGLLKQAVELDPKMVGPLLTLANIYGAQQQLTQAAGWYDRALEAAPDSAEVRVARGHFLFFAGTPEEGRKEFRKAVELSRDQESIKLMLAERYAALGLQGDAERELSGLVADMNSHKARKALAELKLAAGQVAETKPLVSAILEADEHDPVGIYLKGRIALAENDVPQAVGLFEESIGRNATLSGPHLYLGLARLTQGRVDSAQEALREAIRLQPDNEAAHLTLAKLYLAQQKQAEAEKEAWQALRLNPANLEAAVLYGDAYVLGKNWAKADEVYGAIVRQLPGQPIGYVKMATLRKVQGQSAEAAQLFSQALSHAPNDLVILQDYLVALVESKQEPRADAVLKEYLSKASHDPNLWRLAGRVHLSQRRTDQAEQALRKAVDLAPDLALVYYELGQLYLVQRKLSAAESAFQAALKKDETNSEVHTALGLVLAAQGRVDLANTHYRRAVQLDRHNVVAANNLAASLTEQQEFDDALGLALAAHDRAPSNPGIQDTLGWIYYKKNRFEDAHRLLAEASAALPQHPTVRYHHAMLLSKIGKQEAALSELKTALSLPGGFPEADRAARMVAANKIDE
ncbi:MAG: tetratricopeptide repeat protein [Fimbriimonadaceae bacterium]|nr:tetratricopeptide repeat protein [Fimbriimonadaceae bacterium]MBX3649432.1 tetratricopeptide repeat protein [Rhodocyclaceae bacterium]